MRGSAELGVTASAAVGTALRLVAIGDQGRDVLARFDRIAIGERLPAMLRSRFGGWQLRGRTGRHKPAHVTAGRHADRPAH
jgi:hypothetical protein